MKMKLQRYKVLSLSLLSVLTRCKERLRAVKRALNGDYDSVKEKEEGREDQAGAVKAAERGDQEKDLVARHEREKESLFLEMKTLYAELESGKQKATQLEAALAGERARREESGAETRRMETAVLQAQEAIRALETTTLASKS